MKEINPTRRKLRRERDHEEIQTEAMSYKQNTSQVITSRSSIFTFILLIFTLLIYDLILTSKEDTVNPHAIERELTTNVHNQIEALSVIIDSFKKMYNHEQNVSVVNFIGTNGVGKTFIANILKKHFFPYIFELNGAHDTTLRQNILNRIKDASSSDHNLIIIDDLSVVDVDNVLSFLKEIPQELAALVICIFNIQETDSNLNYTINYKHIDDITEKFNKAEVPHAVAKFHEFDRSQASAWVIKQLILKGVDPELHSDIFDSVLIDQNIKCHGLKGLSSKINLLL